MKSPPRTCSTIADYKQWMLFTFGSKIVLAFVFKGAHICQKKGDQ